MADNQIYSVLSEDQKKELLKLSLSTIEHYTNQAVIPEYKTEDPLFLQESAVFVTLRIGDRLRGCVGKIQADTPLYLAVQLASISAAFSDPRFPAVCQEEIPSLRIKIAILSPLEEISIDDIEVGKHGLMITDQGRKGLLLPEVAADRNWDKFTFLENLCLKAGLPGDSWKTAKLYGFTTQVIE